MGLSLLQRSSGGLAENLILSTPHPAHITLRVMDMQKGQCKSLKGTFKQEDPLLAFIVYRSTPTRALGYSPAELLIGPYPITWIRAGHNRRNGVRHLPPLDSRDGVLMKLDNERQWTTPGVLQGNCSTPRSYDVVTPQGGCYRRNRRHLLQVPNATTHSDTMCGV